jgi:hypothetical protein
VVRNRNYAERDISTTARDETKADFFFRGIWSFFSPFQLGVAILKTRLTNLQRNQIFIQLSNVIEDVKKGIKQC